MSTTYSMLLITTAADNSAVFFTDRSNWFVHVIDYSEITSLDLEKQYDFVYFRDPFNTLQTIDFQKLKRDISHIVKSQAGAYFVDHIASIDDVLIEDKLKQYDFAKDFYPETKQMSSVSELRPNSLAKKRLSSRSRGIVFAADELEKRIDQYIIQSRLKIKNEYRVYVVDDTLLPLAATRTSKSESTKTKVKNISKLPDEVFHFAYKVKEKFSFLDFYGMDIAETSEGLFLLEINRSPQFSRYNELSSTNIASEFMTALEKKTRLTLGSIETVILTDLGVSVTAKVDTGAWSGTLHCTDIYEKEGELFYTPLGDPKLSTSTSVYDIREVRSANGHVDKRYLIPMSFTVEERSYNTVVGISDRSDMQREMLLGRKFLIESNALVDVSLTLDDDYEAERFL